MLFRVMIKKTVIRILPVIALLVFLLDRIALIENSIFRIIGFYAALIGFSVIFTILEYVMYRKLNRNKSEPVETPRQNTVEAAENNVIEELVPVEEENDFGELIEVDDQIQQPVELTSSVLEPEPEIIEYYTAANLHENIEELEVLDESVEELEPIDE